MTARTALLWFVGTASILALLIPSPAHVESVPVGPSADLAPAATPRGGERDAGSELSADYATGLFTAN